MSATPAWLGHLRRHTPAEPKPVLDLTAARPVLEEPVPARLGRISPPPETWPRRSWLNAELTESDVYREDVVLERLAELTNQCNDPRKAAMRMFGGDQSR